MKSELPAACLGCGSGKGKVEGPLMLLKSGLVEGPGDPACPLLRLWH